MLKLLLSLLVFIASITYVNAQDCPAYAAAPSSEVEACGNQDYIFSVANTGCDGLIYFDVIGNYGLYADEIYWEVESQLSGATIGMGGSYANEPFDFTIGPMDPAVHGRVFTLYVLNIYGNLGYSGFGPGGFISVEQDGTQLSYTDGDFGAFSSTMFNTNITISPATLTITNQSIGAVTVASVDYCKDFNVRVPLENNSFCSTTDVDLLWEIVCDETGAILSGGTHTVTVSPQVPTEASDLVDITWNSTSCSWDVIPTVGCDLSDVNSLITISPDPATMEMCGDGTQDFTVSYTGVAVGPNCCERAGPLETITYDQSLAPTSPIAAISPFGAPNSSALYRFPPNTIGGEATSLQICATLTGFYFNNAYITDQSYYVSILVDGNQIFMSGAQTHPGGFLTTCFDLSDVPGGYDQTSVVEVYLFPNTLEDDNGGFSPAVGSVFAPNKSSWQLAPGEWTVDNFDVTFTATFTESIGSPVNCDFPLTAAYTTCCDDLVIILAKTNPTTCGGTDGSITISGLDASIDYDISYSNNSTVTGPTTITSNAAGEIVIPGLGAGDYTDITVELTSCPECVIVNTVGVTLDEIPVPAIDAGADEAICAGESVTLNATGDGTITWDNGVADGVAFIPTATTTYTATSTVPGCTATDAVTITVNPVPVVTINPVADLCTNSADVTLVGSPTGGTFSGPGVTAGVFDPATAGDGAHTITYDYTDATTTCPSSETITINVNEEPTFTVLGVDPTACSATDGAIEINDLAANTVYSVSYENTAGATVGPLTLTSDATGQVIIPTLGNGSYTNFVVDLGGCQGTDNSVVNLTDPNGPALDAGADEAICAGESVTLNATGDGTITWDNGVTNGVAFIPTATTTYTATTTVAGCTSTDAVTITVHPLPTVTIDAVADLCTNSADVTLVGSPTGGTFSGPGVTAGVFDPATAGDGAHTITYDYTDATTTCPSSETITINVNEEPTFTVSGVDPTACSATDGAIEINDLAANTVYSVSYENTAGATVGPLTLTSDATGQVIIPTLGNGSYTNFVVDLGGCQGMDNSVVNLTDPNGPAVDAGADQTICEGANVTLTAFTDAGATISWNNGVIDGTAFPAPAVTTTYTVTSTLAGCTSTDQVTVTVKPNPIIDAGADESVCEGSEITLSGTYPTGANISWDNGVTDNVPFEPTVGGTYTFTAELDGCTSTDDLEVTINPLPTPSIPAIANQCETETELTLVGNPTGGDFSGTAVTAGVFDPSAVGVGNHTITYEFTDGNGCSNTATGTIEVVASPTFTIAATHPTQCTTPDGVITISGLLNTTAYSITYEDADGNTVGPANLTSDANGEIALDDLEPGNYTDFIVDLGGCAGSDNSIVNLVAPGTPIVNAGAPQTVCDGEQVTLTALDYAAGDVITWNNGVVDGVAFSAPTTTTTYTVTAIAANGCRSTDEVIVTVTPNPIVDAGEDQTVCMGDEVTLTATNPNSADITWDHGFADGEPFVQAVGTMTYTVTATLNGCSATDEVEVTVNTLPTPTIDPLAQQCDDETEFILAGTPTGGTFSGTSVTGGIFNPSTAGLGPHTITYTFTDGDGCIGTTTDIVEVISGPVIDAGEDIEMCEGGLVTLTGVTNEGTISWSDGVVDGETFIPQVGTTTYTLTGEIGSCTSTDEITVTVIANPTVDAGEDITVCEGEQVTLSGAGAATYVWDNGVVDGQAFTPPSGTTTYTVTGTTAEGCQGDDEVTVTVTNALDVSFNASNTKGCAPLTVSFTNTSASNGACKYTLSNGVELNSCNPTHTFTQPGCYDVTLTVENNQGCSGTHTETSMICVDAPPVANFVANPNDISILVDEVSFFNTSKGANSYVWSFGDGEGSNETHPKHEYELDEESYTVQLIAMSELGCTDTTYTVINVVEELVYYIPNSFTPDNNHVNQIFKPIFISGFDPMDYNFTIFNRWGEKVFESNDSDFGWDGSYGTGAGGLVQDGVYVYKIVFKSNVTDKRVEVSGHVTLMR